MAHPAESVLVAGGAGYIGSHVCLALQAAGFTPVILDNLSTGNADYVEGFPLVHADISDSETVASVLHSHGISAVMQFAASIQVEESVRHPGSYYDNNFCRSLNFFRTCIEMGVRKLVFSSSAAVYGIPNRIPIPETAPLAPINPYGRSKMMVEMLLEDLSRSTPGFHYAALRYFNVAGADRGGRIGQNYPRATHLITLALRAALGRMPELAIFGTDYPTPDGTAVRDYIDIEDIAALHVLALQSLETSPRNLVLNCGYGHGFSVREVVSAVQRVTGRNFPVREAPRRPGDPSALVADSSRVRTELGWSPAHDNLDAVIRAAWEWERKLPREEASP